MFWYDHSCRKQSVSKTYSNRQIESGRVFYLKKKKMENLHRTTVIPSETNLVLRTTISHFYSIFVFCVTHGNFFRNRKFFLFWLFREQYRGGRPFQKRFPRRCRLSSTARRPIIKLSQKPHVWLYVMSNNFVFARQSLLWIQNSVTATEWSSRLRKYRTITSIHAVCIYYWFVFFRFCNIALGKK